MRNTSFSHPCRLYLSLAAFVVILLLISAVFIRIDSIEETHWDDGLPTIGVDGVSYMPDTREFTNFKECPNGFVYTGDLITEDQGIRAYYTSPDAPDWIYVYQWCREQYSDDIFEGYVRYIKLP